MFVHVVAGAVALASVNCIPPVVQNVLAEGGGRHGVEVDSAAQPGHRLNPELCFLLEVVLLGRRRHNEDWVDPVKEFESKIRIYQVKARIIGIYKRTHG